MCADDGLSAIKQFATVRGIDIGMADDGVAALHEATDIVGVRAETVPALPRAFRVAGSAGPGGRLRARET